MPAPESARHRALAQLEIPGRDLFPAVACLGSGASRLAETTPLFFVRPDLGQQPGQLLRSFPVHARIAQDFAVALGLARQNRVAGSHLLDQDRMGPPDCRGEHEDPSVTRQLLVSRPELVAREDRVWRSK